MHSHKTECYLHVLRAGFLFNQFQRPQCDGLRAIDLRARRRAQPHLELPCLHPREYLGPKPAPDERNDDPCDHEIRCRHQQTPPHHATH